jgi:hypothetical protein
MGAKAFKGQTNRHPLFNITTTPSANYAIDASFSTILSFRGICSNPIKGALKVKFPIP